MNKSLIAGAAFLVGAAVAVPAVAWSAGEPQSPASGTEAPAAPGAGPHHGPADSGGMHGPMRMHGMGMRGMGMHGMAEMSPQQRCEHRLAHRAARAAYVASLLNLTPEQRPLYEKLRAAMQAAADKQHQLCASLKPRDEQNKETILDRVNRREEFLMARLQAIQSTRPALQALYQALTPEQKAIIDHPRRRH